MTGAKAIRRRGQALENAILEAAWDELLDQGYPNLTVESVAKRAGTNRSVLSRRWRNRADLTIAAIGWYLQKHPVAVPDLGNVRDELTLFLQKISDRGMVAVTRIFFSMRDYFIETNSSLADLRSKFATNQTGNEIFQRAVRRGEIDPSKLTKRVASLPLDLVRHEGFMTQKPIPRAVITEILDTIFLPLVGTNKTLRVKRRG
jgi:AcrR family transcriptional regulator